MNAFNELFESQLNANLYYVEIIKELNERIAKLEDLK